MGRKAKKRSVSGEFAEMMTIFAHTAFGLLMLIAVLLVLLFVFLICVTGNSYHIVYLSFGIISLILIIVAWLRYYMQDR